VQLSATRCNFKHRFSTKMIPKMNLPEKAEIKGKAVLRTCARPETCARASTICFLISDSRGIGLLEHFRPWPSTVARLTRTKIARRHKKYLSPKVILNLTVSRNPVKFDPFLTVSNLARQIDTAFLRNKCTNRRSTQWIPKFDGGRHSGFCRVFDGEINLTMDIMLK